MNTIASKRPAKRPAQPTPTQPTPIERLEADICRGAANLNAAEAGWLALVAEFDRRRGWESWGCLSCAAWLSWQVGLDRRAAREKVRVARALEAMPSFAEAMRTGALTSSKVRAITRIATPANAPDLLALAIAGTSNHVERIVAAYRRCQPSAEAAEARAHERRAVSVRTEGAVTEITIRLPVEPGQAVLAAIDRFMDDDVQISRSARQVDALVAMAERAIATAEQPALADDRYLVTLHLDPDVFRDEADELDDADPAAPPTASAASSSRATATASPGSGSCAVAAGSGLAGDAVGVPLTTARRLLCDAALQSFAAAGDGETGMRLGRSSRVVSRRLRRALRLRDGGCVFPGCDRSGWIDAHHVRHWIDGGTTDAENLVCLCRFHHRLVHEGGWSVGGGPSSSLAFIRPDGTHLDTEPTTVVAGGSAAVDSMGRSDVDGRSGWQGDRLDLDMAINTMLLNEQARASAAAGATDRDTAFS